MQNDARAGGVGFVADGAGNIGGEVAVGSGAGRKAKAGGELRSDAVDAEGAPVAAGGVPRNQIPAAAGMYEAMRFHGARGGRSVTVAVSEAKRFAIAAGAGDGREDARVHGRSVAGHGQDRGMKGGGAAAQAFGDNLLQLGEGAN